MIAVLRSLRTLTSRALRLAAALAAAAQLVLNVAPVVEGRGGPDAGMHVEAAGLSLHHAHDAAACPACAAQQLVGHPAAAPALWDAVGHDGQTARPAPLPPVVLRSPSNLSRAPPASLS
jgi:hypothetical protein